MNLLFWFLLLCFFTPSCNAGRDKRLIHFLTADNELDVTGFLCNKSNWRKMLSSKKDRRKFAKEEAKKQKRKAKLFKSRATFNRRDPLTSTWYLLYAYEMYFF